MHCRICWIPGPGKPGQGDIYSMKWRVTEMKIKAFAMNEYDWMAGADLESCVSLYLAEYAGGLPRDEVLDEPHKRSEWEMDRREYVDPDGERCTFREQLEKLVASGQQFPAFFASTEY